MNAIFSRYFFEDKLVEVSMNEMLEFIQNEDNKEKIADLIYYRLYNRFLKLFFFESSKSKVYIYNNAEVSKNEFKTEFKSGFLMMASACILIETLSSYLNGVDKTIYGKGKESYNLFFEKCKDYKNDLHLFRSLKIYKNIRNGLLHQGEVYGSFSIRRNGKLYDSSKNKINAYLFVKNLNIFLERYIKDLKSSNWDSEIWNNCRSKIRFIANN